MKSVVALFCKKNFIRTWRLKFVQSKNNLRETEAEIIQSMIFFFWISLKQPTGTTKRKGKPSKPFLKIVKNCLVLDNNWHDCFHLWFKFLVLNAVLRVSSKIKTKKSFLQGLSFACYGLRCLSKCPNSKKTPLPWKTAGFAM